MIFLFIFSIFFVKVWILLQIMFGCLNSSSDDGGCELIWEVCSIEYELCVQVGGQNVDCVFFWF